MLDRNPAWRALVPAGTAGAPAAPSAATGADAVVGGSVVAMFGAYFSAFIFLQKFSFGPADAQVSVIVPATYLLLLGLARLGRLRVSPGRLMGFALFVALASLSQLLPRQAISLPSFLALPVLYLPLVCSAKLSTDERLAVLTVFQRLMLVIAAVVVVQFAAFRMLHASFSLERLVPPGFLLSGYNYDVAAGSPVRPNGVFFLETSFVSIFLATALIIEIMHFRKLHRLAAFAIALALSLGGSGLLMVAIAAPLLLLRARPATALQIVAGLVLLGLPLLLSGAAQSIFARAGEFSQSGSSGYLRVVEPLQQLVDAFGRETTPFAAVGAGNAPTGPANAWAVTKLAYEYGFVVALLLPVLVVAATWSWRQAPLLLPLLLIYNFAGGYLHSPVLVPLLLMFGALLRPEPGRATELARPAAGEAADAAAA